MEKHSTEDGEKVSLSDMIDILDIMVFYNRKSGYIAHDKSGKLRFYDSEPSCGGALITREQVSKFIEETSLNNLK
jgi:hypothetical protein